MTTHLFAGTTVQLINAVTIEVNTQITTCCHVHVFGLPAGDLGTLDPDACDCPSVAPKEDKP